MRRKVGRALAIDLIGRADVDLLELAQDIQQHDGKRIDPADSGAVPGGDSIEPAAAPGTTGYGAVFPPHITNVLADVVVQFGRKGPTADARRIGLHDADHSR